MTPFDVLKTDIDEFILLCNYLVDLEGDNKTPSIAHNEKEEAAAFWAAL